MESKKSKNTKDILGQTFGHYTVLEHKGKDAHRSSLWLVQCICGKQEILNRGILLTGKQHCGCIPKCDKEPHPNFKDHTGETFNYLKALKPTGNKNGAGHYVWQLQCVCGNIVERTKGKDFGKDGNNSCGCVKTNLKHDMSKSKVYQVWAGMKARCTKESAGECYENYGGRGITYDPRWEDFAEFWADMGEGYKEGLTIDRKDVNGNYCKENCRWLPRARQPQGTRKRKDKWTSKFKGVALQRNGMWLAQTQKDKVVERSGPYIDEVDAAKAYDDMVLRLFGEFATTNKSLGLL